jgi:hypothetical protein
MTTRITLAAATAVAVLALAACSSPSNSSGASGNSAAPTGGTGGGSSSGGRFGGGAPGASGLIAAIDGNTLQVQSQQLGQVAVTVSAATTYTQTVATTLSAVKAGVCVTAVAPQSSSSATPSAAPSSAPSGSQTRPTSITAGTVSISTPTNGTCGFGGRQRTGGGSGFPTNRPSGFPTGRPSGGFGGNRGFGQVLSGLVTAVSGSTISVKENQFTPGSSTTATVDGTVTVTSSTKYTTVAPATKAALKVGKCATAIGAADSTGAVKATRVAISTPSSTGCTSGFGFGRGGAGN